MSPRTPLIGAVRSDGLSWCLGRGNSRTRALADNPREAHRSTHPCFSLIYLLPQCWAHRRRNRYLCDEHGVGGLGSGRLNDGRRVHGASGPGRRRRCGVKGHELLRVMLWLCLRGTDADLQVTESKPFRLAPATREMLKGKEGALVDPPEQDGNTSWTTQQIRGTRGPLISISHDASLWCPVRLGTTRSPEGRDRFSS